LLFFSKSDRHNWHTGAASFAFSWQYVDRVATGMVHLRVRHRHHMFVPTSSDAGSDCDCRTNRTSRHAGSTYSMVGMPTKSKLLNVGAAA
jgi:hypothetical protein